MTNLTLRDRLVEIIVGAIIDGGPVGDHPALIADALLASKEWQAREAVVRAAKAEHAHCDGVGVDLDNDAATPCFVCGALGRLTAVRGTT